MSEDNEILIGTVIWFNSRKGYGFLQQAKDSPDIFVYWSDINQPEGGFKTLNKDDKVSYEVGVNNAGRPKAIRVTVIK